MKRETKLDIICISSAYLANFIGIYLMWLGYLI